MKKDTATENGAAAEERTAGSSGDGNRRGTARRRQTRDAVASREKILVAGLKEFCAKGFDGARIDQIAKRARCNIRMIYHYSRSKESLYLAALERVYRQLRSREEELDLLHLDPLNAMSALVEFTFDHMLEHQEFIRMISNENTLQGHYLKKSKFVTQASIPLVETIKDLLRRGQKEGVFRKNVDPIQLYISILSLSYVHVSNRYTLSITFQQDLSDPKWLAKRRRHVRKVILGFLRS